MWRCGGASVHSLYRCDDLLHDARGKPRMLRIALLFHDQVHQLLHNSGDVLRMKLVLLLKRVECF